MEQKRRIGWDALLLLLLIAAISIPIVTALGLQPTEEEACTTETY